MADCYAEVPLEERHQEMRALVFDPEGRFVTSVTMTCLAELDKRHSHDAQIGASLEEEVLALVRRYKHGNVSRTSW